MIYMMISVIMSTYNENIYELKTSVNSILKQTISDIELIIIDDNPDYFDLKNYLLNLKKKEKRIKVYFNNKNLGAAKARNVGVLHSSGYFIAIIDADDISKQDRFEKQLRFLKNNDLDFTFSNFQKMDYYKNISKPLYRFKSIVNVDDIKYLFANYENISLQSSWFIKREVFFKLKGYRNIIIEDYDFNVRAITYGYKLGYQKDALVIKRERKNSITSQNSLKQYVTLKAIQRFIKDDNYNNIISLNKIKESTLPFITEKNINKFSMFLKCGREIKHKNNIFKNIIMLFYLLFSSKIIFRFIFHILTIKIMTFKMDKLLLK